MTITGTQISLQHGRSMAAAAFMRGSGGSSRRRRRDFDEQQRHEQHGRIGRTRPVWGGGIYVSGDSGTHPTTLTLQHSTVAGNRAYGTEGGGGSGFARAAGIRFQSGSSSRMGSVVVITIAPLPLTAPWATAAVVSSAPVGACALWGTRRRGIADKEQRD